MPREEDRERIARELAALSWSEFVKAFDQDEPERPERPERGRVEDQLDLFGEGGGKSLEATGLSTDPEVVRKISQN